MSSDTPVYPAVSEEDNDARGRELMLLTAILGAISISTTLLRLGVRAAKRIIGWDDYMIILVMILLIPQMTFVFLEVQSGAGKHIYTLQPADISNVLKWTYLTELFLFLILCTTKISICLFVLRIKNTGWLKWFLYSLIAGLVATTIPVFIVWFAQCSPIESFWDGNFFTQCWSQNIYNDLIWLQVAFSIFGDLACSILPAVVLWNVKIAPALKVAVSGLMGIGLLATICGIVRAVLSPSNLLIDLTFDLALVSQWATAEIHLGIIGANMALMRMVYMFFKNRGVPTEARYQNYGSSNSKGVLNSHTFARKARGHNSTTASDDETYPLESGIRKTTDYYVTTEAQLRKPSPV